MTLKKVFTKQKSIYAILLLGIFTFLRTQKIFYIHTNNFARSEHKMLMKNANLFRTQRSGNT